MDSMQSYLAPASLLVPASKSSPDACHSAVKPINVFVLAGQSNMVGHGKTRAGLNPDYDPSQPQAATNRREVPGGIGGHGSLLMPGLAIDK